MRSSAFCITLIISCACKMECAPATWRCNPNDLPVPVESLDIYPQCLNPKRLRPGIKSRSRRWTLCWSWLSVAALQPSFTSWWRNMRHVSRSIPSGRVEKVSRSRFFPVVGITDVAKRIYTIFLLTGFDLFLFSMRLSWFFLYASHTGS